MCCFFSVWPAELSNWECRIEVFQSHREDPRVVSGFWNNRNSQQELADGRSESLSGPRARELLGKMCRGYFLVYLIFVVFWRVGVLGTLLGFHFVYEKNIFKEGRRRGKRLLKCVCVISWATKNTPSFDVVAAGCPIKVPFLDYPARSTGFSLESRDILIELIVF